MSSRPKQLAEAVEGLTTSIGAKPLEPVDADADPASEEWRKKWSKVDQPGPTIVYHTLCDVNKVSKEQFIWRCNRILGELVARGVFRADGTKAGITFSYEIRFSILRQIKATWPDMKTNNPEDKNKEVETDDEEQDEPLTTKKRKKKPKKNFNFTDHLLHALISEIKNNQDASSDIIIENKAKLSSALKEQQARKEVGSSIYQKTSPSTFPHTLQPQTDTVMQPYPLEGVALNFKFRYTGYEDDPPSVQFTAINLNVAAVLQIAESGIKHTVAQLEDITLQKLRGAYLRFKWDVVKVNDGNLELWWKEDGKQIPKLLNDDFSVQANIESILELPNPRRMNIWIKWKDLRPDTPPTPKDDDGFPSGTGNGDSDDPSPAPKHPKSNNSDANPDSSPNGDNELGSDPKSPTRKQSLDLDLDLVAASAPDTAPKPPQSTAFSQSLSAFGNDTSVDLAVPPMKRRKRDYGASIISPPPFPSHAPPFTQPQQPPLSAQSDPDVDIRASMNREYSPRPSPTLVLRTPDSQYPQRRGQDVSLMNEAGSGPKPPRIFHSAFYSRNDDSAPTSDPPGYRVLRSTHLDKTPAQPPSLCPSGSDVESPAPYNSPVDAGHLPHLFQPLVVPPTDEEVRALVNASHWYRHQSYVEVACTLSYANMTPAQFRNVSAPVVQLPGMRRKLYSYQAHAMVVILLKAFRLGGMYVADEAGLGKTPMMIALIRQLQMMRVALEESESQVDQTDITNLGPRHLDPKTIPKSERDLQRKSPFEGPLCPKTNSRWCHCTGRLGSKRYVRIESLSGAHLIVCPIAVMKQWVTETTRFSSADHMRLFVAREDFANTQFFLTDARLCDILGNADCEARPGQWKYIVVVNPDSLPKLVGRAMKLWSQQPGHRQRKSTKLHDQLKQMGKDGVNNGPYSTVAKRKAKLDKWMAMLDPPAKKDNEHDFGAYNDVLCLVPPIPWSTMTFDEAHETYTASTFKMMYASSVPKPSLVFPLSGTPIETGLDRITPYLDLMPVDEEQWSRAFGSGYHCSPENLRQINTAINTEIGQAVKAVRQRVDQVAADPSMAQDIPSRKEHERSLQALEYDFSHNELQGMCRALDQVMIRRELEDVWVDSEKLAELPKWKLDFDAGKCLPSDNRTGALLRDNEKEVQRRYEREILRKQSQKRASNAETLHSLTMEDSMFSKFYMERTLATYPALLELTGDKDLAMTADSITAANVPEWEALTPEAIKHSPPFDRIMTELESQGHNRDGSWRVWVILTQAPVKALITGFGIERRLGKGTALFITNPDQSKRAAFREAVASLCDPNARDANFARQSGIRVVVGTTGTLGSGINMQMACGIILLEPCLSVNIELQCIRRIVRPGNSAKSVKVLILHTQTFEVAHHDIKNVRRWLHRREKLVLPQPALGSEDDPMVIA